MRYVVTAAVSQRVLRRASTADPWTMSSVDSDAHHVGWADHRRLPVPRSRCRGRDVPPHGTLALLPPRCFDRVLIDHVNHVIADPRLHYHPVQPVRPSGGKPALDSGLVLRGDDDGPA